MALVTWNPSDKNANLTLSNGNLTATNSTGSARPAVRATYSHDTTGKFYFEVLVTASRCNAGIMRAASSLSGIDGVGTASTDYGFTPDNNAGAYVKINNGSGLLDTHTLTAPETLQVAVDFAAGKIWFGSNNVWMSSGNPAAGTNPIFTSITGTYFPAFSAPNPVPNSGTGHFKAADLTYSPPSGFSAWDDTVDYVGTAAGTSTAVAVGGSIRTSTGTAAGISTALAVSPPGTGTAVGTSTALAVGFAFAPAGTATGTSTALAVGRIVFTDALVSTANIVANTQLTQTLVVVSTANATSTLFGFETQTEVSHANATSSVSTKANVTLALSSTANATSNVSGGITFALVSTANATSVVPKTPLIATYVSTANAVSNVLGTTKRTETLISTADATSSVEATRFVQLVSTANVTSSLAGTSVTPGALVSTANVTSNITGSRNKVVWSSTSHANITASVSGKTTARSTYVSTADIRAYIVLPGLPGGLSALWCNPITHAAASWSGTPFESVIEVDGVMYGAGAEGIYKMEDELDETTEVSAYVTWDLLDFGDPKKHRPGDFMITGTAGAPLKVTVANEQGRYSYLTHLPENTIPTNFRARLGKGLHSRHLRFTVENTKSKDFWFDAAEIEVIQLSRHIGGRHA